MTYPYSNYYNQDDYLHLVLYNRKPDFFLVKTRNNRVGSLELHFASNSMIMLSLQL